MGIQDQMIPNDLCTRGEELVLNSSVVLKIDSYPGADFASMYRYEVPTDPVCVKS